MLLQVPRSEKDWALACAEKSATALRMVINTFFIHY
jgi:hypothetical protein